MLLMSLKRVQHSCAHSNSYSIPMSIMDTAMCIPLKFTNTAI